MRRFLWSVLLTMCLAGCGQAAGAQPRICQVVLEQNDCFTVDAPIQTTLPGGEVVFTLHPKPGAVLTGCDDPDATLSRSAQGFRLTVPQVKYSTVVSVAAQWSDTAFVCHANDGTGAVQTVPVTANHLRLSTPDRLFARRGHTQTGWALAPEGDTVVQGGRVSAQGETPLYAQWEPWESEQSFTWREENGAAVLTGCVSQSAVLTVPGELDGLPVRTLAAGTLDGLPCERLVLPDTLRHWEEGAVRNCAALREITAFDSLSEVHALAVQNCPALRTLRLQAATPPRYSAGYFASFADKYDRLTALEQQQKLVLFSGSSTRFGYDSAALDAALPQYAVVNMGVFAYTNALPQMLLILDRMQAGDVLLHTPEFDAAKRQFCTTNQLDAAFFCMMEANYEMLAALDLRQVDGVFAALNEYLTTRALLPGVSRELSAADFDEDGLPVETPSYNEYGDYCLYRPNAADDAPVYGLPVDYTSEAFPAEQYLTPLNAVYRRFQQKGVTVLFDYAPRNRQAISAASTPEARAALESYLRRNLCVPVLGTLEGSLWPGRYLSGTDNHLSTEGAALRTRMVLEEWEALS